MKMFHLDLLRIFLGLSLITLGIALPSFVIESIWNASIASSIMERDLSIDLWQASLLWGSLITALYMLGIFKVKIAFKSLDSIDINEIDDPDLRSKIVKLKRKVQEENSNEEDPKL